MMEASVEWVVCVGGYSWLRLGLKLLALYYLIAAGTNREFWQQKEIPSATVLISPFIHS